MWFVKLKEFMEPLKCFKYIMTYFTDIVSCYCSEIFKEIFHRRYSDSKLSVNFNLLGRKNLPESVHSDCLLSISR